MIRPSFSATGPDSPGYQQAFSTEHNEDSALLTGKRVVVVEDEGIIQMQLGKCLRRLGLEVVGTANNGLDGVVKSLAVRPDIILMDVNLPGNINGLEAARQILSVYHPCLVILTAYSDYIEEAKRIGTCGYIVKPIDNVTLLYHLKKAYHAFLTKQDMQ